MWIGRKEFEALKWVIQLQTDSANDNLRVQRGNITDIQLEIYMIKRDLNLLLGELNLHIVHVKEHHVIEAMTE